MDTLSFDWPQSAAALVAHAERRSDLARLIMAGTSHVDSWLIENRILPVLREKQPGRLVFSSCCHGDGERTATLIPLPDGSAFACDASGRWSALEASAALHEIGHLGYRFAPGKRWQHGFSARIESANGTLQAASPEQAAAFWEQVTGERPHGFSAGALDQVEAIGLDVIERLFSTQGHLGL